MLSGADHVVRLWNEWGIRVLVLLSFTLQVVLLVLAEFRRRMDSGVLRFFVWSAYLLADSIAIYVLGHLSVTSRSPEHELMAFWAPFLLLHLGGQDNITAYAIEDNNLWLRHLQTLSVQVAAAVYILYQSSILGRLSLLLPATILMFVVGVVKYGERVWVLRCAGSSPGGSNYRSIERSQVLSQYIRDDTGFLDREASLRIAHTLLDVPKDLLLEGAVSSTEGINTDLTGEEAYKVVEMQISLMHDVLYTKAEVMHTWYGLCIRIVSSQVTTVAFVLFTLLLLDDHHGKLKGYNIVDVAATYVLLGGALLLEIMSLLRAMFSSWTWALLLRWETRSASSKVRNIWALLARGVLSLRRLVHAADWRRRSWSRAMGQHNMLQLCAHSSASRRSKIARWLGVEDPWNMLVYSWSVPVSSFIEQLMVKQLLLNYRSCSPERWSPDHIISTQGREVLNSLSLFEKLDWTVEESILVWHIATDIYLYWYKEHQEATGWQDDAQARRRDDHAKAVEELSNYMLFLLAARPHMLLPPAGRNAYVQMCYAVRPSNLKKRGASDLLVQYALDYSSVEDLVSSLRRLGHALNTGSPPLTFVSTTAVIGRSDSAMPVGGAQLGAKLISEDRFPGSSTGDKLDLIVEVWVQMLLYVGCGCSAYSHAKQLSSGGELITVAALLAKYIIGGMTSHDPALHSADPFEHSDESIGVNWR